MKSKKQQATYIISNVLVFLFLTIVFIVPFVYILLMASKSSKEAALLRFSLPAQNLCIQNLKEVIAYGDYRMFRALLNSTLLTIGSVALIVVFSALFAFVAQRGNKYHSFDYLHLLPASAGHRNDGRGCKRLISGIGSKAQCASA
ncbi:MAG: raffinose/stachyose/melibiose transport system permease protein [Sphaerochaeta sp.]|jgi:raffinose/stachyose/melibiose transport system permease protein|nr:raffinose/stachyose/melibiose transport system permease protein [Sphaerochaeta sp.]